MIAADPADSVRLLQKVQDFVDSASMKRRDAQEPRARRHQDAVLRGPFTPGLRYTPMLADPGSRRCEDRIEFAVIGFCLRHRLPHEELPEQRLELRHDVDRE